MSRRVFQLVAALVVALATLTPLVNCFDTWDKGQPPANDTELQVTALFLGAAFALALPRLVRRLLVSVVRLQPTARRSVTRLAGVLCDRSAPEPSSSPPPLPLRI